MVALVVDIILYALLTAYFDKVRPPLLSSSSEKEDTPGFHTSASWFKLKEAPRKLCMTMS